MTIAVDKTGAVVGQVVDETPQLSLDRDPLARKRYLILGRDGWKSIEASTVRLETVDSD